ncbi:MAG: prolipoprotein diacylglyceryl transferase [Flammeovirgaceae bacterium]|nr:prolipoprotein diacylglyceryl transferase [Flammeovirgaceae bacterium]
MSKANWIDKLKERWGVNSGFQVLIIFVVFGITGSSTAFVTRKIFEFLDVTSDTSFLYKIPIYILGFFIYQALLLAFGAVFGQFTFFYNFEKKTFGRFGKLFGKKPSPKSQND